MCAGYNYSSTETDLAIARDREIDASTVIREIDAATVNIVSNALHGIAEEMGANLMRTARSTILREARDFSCALFDQHGRVIAEAEHIPIQMSSLKLPLRECLRKHDVADLRPGDLFFTNDPFGGGQHLQDLIMYLPVFVEGELMGFTAALAHHNDIGGATPGMTFDARQYYQEGLRFPALKARESDLEPNGFLVSLIEGNFRQPGISTGDLRAQYAACHLGRQRLTDLVQRYGLECVRTCVERGLDYSERLMRKAISEVPDGTYEAADRIDRGVFSDDPVEVRLRMEITGDEMLLDFAGSAPQCEDFLNVPYGTTFSACMSAIKLTMGAGRLPIPANEGCHRPIRIDLPEGSFLCPQPPAAVRARVVGSHRVYDCILMALAQAVPDRMPAPGFDANTASSFFRQDGAEVSIFLEAIGGGWGATPTADGQEMLDVPLSNCKITPSEVVEMDYPWLRVRRWEFDPDSGGAGKFRGGLGSVREYEILADGVRYTGYGDRHRFAPPGAVGGRPGGRGSFVRIRDGERAPLPTTGSTPLQAGDRIEIRLGGGGGYGDPLERDPGAIRADLRAGKVTPDGLLDYGISVSDLGE